MGVKRNYQILFIEDRHQVKVNKKFNYIKNLGGSQSLMKSKILESNNILESHEKKNSDRISIFPIVIQPFDPSFSPISNEQKKRDNLEMQRKNSIQNSIQTLNSKKIEEKSTNQSVSKNAEKYSKFNFEDLKDDTANENNKM